MIFMNSTAGERRSVTLCPPHPLGIKEVMSSFNSPLLLLLILNALFQDSHGLNLDFLSLCHFFLQRWQGKSDISHLYDQTTPSVTGFDFIVHNIKYISWQSSATSHCRTKLFSLLNSFITDTISFSTVWLITELFGTQYKYVSHHLSKARVKRQYEI